MLLLEIAYSEKYDTFMQVAGNIILKNLNKEL